MGHLTISGWLIMFQWLNRIFKKPVMVSKAEVYQIIHPFCSDITQLADREWKLLSDKEFMEITLDSGVRDRMYRNEVYDCDNFAHSLVEAFNGKGYLVGIIQGFLVPGEKHRWVFYVNDKKKVVHIEPQTYEQLYPDKRLRSDFVYTI